jgi:hypothetical protein
MDINTFDIFILAMRVVLICLLYFFIFLVVRVITREFNMATRRARMGVREPSYAPPDMIAPSQLGPHLVITEIGNATTVRPGAIFELGPVVPIGRRPTNLIVLNDDFVSTEHALVALRDSQYWVSDAGSTNGTFLNGMPLNGPQPLKPGDVIGVGRVKLRLET